MADMTRDAHARPSGDVPPPLYDPDVAAPTHAERARTLISQSRTGTLCTLSHESTGYPYGSFVTVAFDAGHPVFLVSELAEHTKNLRKDKRASLLVAEGVRDDPLANGRVTLLGQCTPETGNGTDTRHAFLEAHHAAGYYADYKDFSFWKLKVESVRYIGGYGRMSWISGADYLAAEPDPLARVAAVIIAHMNQDHADALVVCCKAFSRAIDIGTASMTAVDRYGFEVSAVTADGPRPVRLAFPQPVTTSDQARKALMAMLQAARAKLE